MNRLRLFILTTIALININSYSRYLQDIGSDLPKLHQIVQDAQSTLNQITLDKKNKTFIKDIKKIKKTLTPFAKKIAHQYRVYDSENNPNSKYKGLLFAQTVYNLEDIISILALIIESLKETITMISKDSTISGKNKTDLLTIQDLLNQAMMIISPDYKISDENNNGQDNNAQSHNKHNKDNNVINFLNPIQDPTTGATIYW